MLLSKSFVKLVISTDPAYYAKAIQLYIIQNEEKKMKALIPLILFTFLFAGCAGSPYQLAQMDSAQLSQVSDYDLLGSLSNTAFRNEMMFDEAKARGLLTDSDIRLVKKGKLKSGMSENTLIATWGHPLKIETNSWRSETVKQYIYGFNTKYSSQTYVIVNRGTVRSWHTKKK